MTETDYLANLMHQVRVNEAAIYLLADKLGVEPEALFNDAAAGVNTLFGNGGFDNAAS